MSLGDDRVGIGFNPSTIPEVDQIKGVTASLIDMLDMLSSQDPEVLRCKEIAQAKYEEACMWAVKMTVRAAGSVAPMETK